jgi:hypothetical protein
MHTRYNATKTTTNRPTDRPTPPPPVKNIKRACAALSLAAYNCAAADAAAEFVDEVRGGTLLCGWWGGMHTTHPHTQPITTQSTNNK